MEIQIKKTIKAGNSSAVVLPRSWLDKEVRVELVKKTKETILAEVIGVLKNYIMLDEVIGIYLVGSYARGEEDHKSDIDVLVITKDSDKEILKEGAYSILIVSEDLLQQKLREDLLPIGQMISEAKPLLNSKYLGLIKIKVRKRNIKWYLDTTKEKLEIIKKIIDKMKKDNKKRVDDLVVYTLVLRIRTLEIIRKLINGEDYSKKNFIRTIKKVSGGLNAYESYLSVKNNLEKFEVTSVDEAEKLYEYLKKLLVSIKKLI